MVFPFTLAFCPVSVYTYETCLLKSGYIIARAFEVAIDEMVDWFLNYNSNNKELLIKTFKYRAREDLKLRLEEAPDWEYYDLSERSTSNMRKYWATPELCGGSLTKEL